MKEQSINLFESYIGYTRNINNENDNTALDVSIYGDGFAKILRKHLKKKGLRFDYKTVEEVIQLTKEFPTFNYIIKHSEDLYNFLGELQFNVFKSTYKDPISLNDYLGIKGIDGYYISKSSTSSHINFEIFIPLTDEEVLDLKTEMEKLVIDPVGEWFDENWDEILTRLENTQEETTQEEIDNRRSVRSTEKKKVKDVEVQGYLAVDDWNKPLLFTTNRGEAKEVGKRIYLVLNDESIRDSNLEV